MNEIHVRFTHSERRFRQEYVPGGKAIFRPDDAKTYQCPYCKRAVFSQNTEPDLPEVACRSAGAGVYDHMLTWGPEE